MWFKLLVYMKKLRFIFLFAVSCYPNLISAQLVDKTPAAIPNIPAIYNTEPWEDPLVSGINRDPSRATAYSFSNINDAISCDRTKTSRMMLLNGDWDFSFALKPSDAPKDFYESRVTSWEKIEVP